MMSASNLIWILYGLCLSIQAQNLTNLQPNLQSPPPPNIPPLGSAPPVSTTTNYIVLPPLLTTTNIVPPPIATSRNGPNRVIQTSSPVNGEIPAQPTQQPPPRRPSRPRPSRRPPTRQPRPCHPGPDLPSVKIVNLKHETIADVNEESQISILSNITWEVDNDFEIDGFIIHFFDNAASKIPILPINVCNIGQSNYWATTTSSSSCLNDSCISTLINENMTSCVCTSDCGGLTSRLRNCVGVDNYYVTSLNFMSIQPNVRSLLFETEFHTTYTLEIRAYYRQFPFERSFLTVLESDCPNSLIESGVNWTSASQICCDTNIPHLQARNFTVGEPMINHASDSMSITVTWLPAAVDDDYNYTLSLGLEQQRVERLPYSSADNVTSCLAFEYYYTSTLDNLRPGKEYYVTIRPTGLDRTSSTLCERGRCNVNRMFNIQDIDTCDERFGYCDVNANCTASDVTGRTTLNATCSCQIGYEGNGINTTIQGKFNQFASGCSDANYCFSSDICSVGALCVDNPAPELGATCMCADSYLGDGMIDGSGCEHVSVLALKIAIPLVVFALLVFAFVAYKIKRKRDFKRDLPWTHFVSNDRLSYTILNSGTAMEGKGDFWKPTFGDKWELERSKVRLDDVIGRGNYGVVYQGWYDNELFAQEVPVAVKTVKEGINEEETLKDFIYEIGFMLNVGDHQNVLGVIGCCTTQKPVLLVTEFLKYGDLLHFLWDARESSKCLNDPAYHVTEKSLCQMARQVARGMEYLTKTRIIHGDLAARNILVGENLICKISDFGLANDVYRYGILQGQSERVVPFKWISPERMMGGKVPITSKSDVWSFGNLMYEMVTLGCMPHPGVSAEDLLEKLKGGYRMGRPSTCSVQLFAIMTKCWKWSAHSRPTFTDLVGSLGVAIDNQKDDNYVNLADNIENLNLTDYENEIKKPPSPGIISNSDEVAQLINGTIPV